MEFEFGDNDLERLATDLRFTNGLPPEVVQAFRKRLQSIDSAVDERDLRAMKGNRFEKLKGKRAHQHSMRLNQQWRLILEIRNGTSGTVLWIMGIEDYH